MNRFNLKVVKQFWAIAKLYWLGNEKHNALGLLVILVVLLFANTLVKVFLTNKQGDVISALAAQDSHRFWQGIFIALLGIIIYGCLNSGYGYLRETIGLYWRSWLTHHFLDKYFSDRAFYELSNFNQDIDNPDQRISEDISSFCLQSVQFLVSIIESLFVVIAFSIVLWSISKNLVFTLIIYSVLGHLITVGFYGKQLTKVYSQQLKKEGNFRFSLVRIREYAESIAFYNGIFQEENKIKLIFHEVFRNFQRLILWSEMYLNIFKHPFGHLPWILPAIIIGNQILAGELEVGKVAEAGGAFSQLAASLNLIIYQFEKFTKFAASIERLYIFYAYLNNSRKETANGKTINLVPDNFLALEDVTLQTPNYQKTLFKNLSLALQPGQGLLIMGESGSGKSSLLRALAGLWNSGTGMIFRPPLQEMLFLPQRPYMILGTLREQLIYPDAKVDVSNQELYQVLQKVNLSDLAERFGGLDVEKDWSDVLSLGEQQRLAFARILVTKPKYVILDEATSALDVNNEENLYRLLLETGITFISVGHRPTLQKYHQLTIHLSSEI
jgi:vitamin B12/bleomycin/antimicrobial peptide transport system ATP-binding/permease protein